MVCSFFGHRNTSENIQPLLRKTLINLIEKDNVDIFYVGNQGNFDKLVIRELKCLSEIYTNIKYYIVLAYKPKKRGQCSLDDYFQTIFPDGLENVPKKFAIDKRNYLMIEWSDIVVTYVSNLYGGAVKFKNIAEKKGKQVINLYINKE